MPESAAETESPKPLVQQKYQTGSGVAVGVGVGVTLQTAGVGADPC